MSGKRNIDDVLLYDIGLLKSSSLSSMKLLLTNAQFNWLAESFEFTESNLKILREHYVNGVELKKLAQEAGFNSPARIYTLVKRFEANVQKKLVESDVEMSVIMHQSGENGFLKFDVSK